MSRLFAGFGAVLRARADTLTATEQANVFRMSHKVDGFDFFISHVSSTPGFKKYITLVVDRLGFLGFAIAAMVSFGIFLFQVYVDELPRSRAFTVHDSFFGHEWTPSVWELLGGVSAAWLVYAFGHILWRRTCCFLDCASICQSDAELKAAGISNIPAFLRASRELVVLWDEWYFTRLWCIYEIAVVQSVGSIPIRILPMDVYAFLALGQVYWYAAGLGWFLFLPWLPGLLGTHVATVLAGVPVFALQAHTGRTFARLFAQLQEQFERFDVRSAAISFDSDRAFICDSIEDMFDGDLDKFNTAVRTTIKSAAMHSLMGQRSIISYWGMMWQLLPAVPFFCSKFSSTMHLPLYYQMPHYIFGVTFVFCVLPVYCAAAMELGKRFAADTPAVGVRAAAVYLGVGLLFGSLLCAWSQSVGILPFWIGVGGMRHLGLKEWHSLFIAVPMNGLACVAAAWAFRPYARVDGVAADSSDESDSQTASDSSVDGEASA